MNLSRALAAALFLGCTGVFGPFPVDARSFDRLAKSGLLSAEC